VVGAAPEPGTGLGPLVAQDLHVGQSGVVIDRGVQVVVAASTRVGPTIGGASGPALGPVTAILGDPAELLGVQVDQVAGPWVLVAADRPAGWAVQPGQPVHSVADQDAVHGGGRQTKPGGDAGRAEPFTPAQPEDALLEVGGGPPGLWAGTLERSTRPAWPSC